MSVGASLTEVRKTASLSTGELSKRTRIPESVIEDLERDNFTTSGGPAYARGHIRNIARVCGADADPILSKFDSQTIPLNKSIRELLNDTNATTAKKVRKPISWKGLTGVAAGVVALFVFGGALISTSNNNDVLSEETTQVVESGPVAKKVDGVEVILKGVNGLSWVAVNDSSGATQYSGRIRQGEQMTFSDDQLLYLVIGNAGAIQLIVNGENLGIPGKVGEVVRLEFGPQALSNQG
ncbi:MAG: helix-turn-helix domain-containing protein [Actinobacteria bacterium]|nr:helix-turn-helix domain-containing protein [Actinomycetota bacterium]